MIKIGDIKMNDKIIICSEYLKEFFDEKKENRDKYYCLPRSSANGEWNVYFINHNNHWINHGDDNQDWEAAALVINSSIKLEDLDNLNWYNDFAYAHVY